MRRLLIGTILLALGCAACAGPSGEKIDTSVEKIDTSGPLTAAPQGRLLAVSAPPSASSGGQVCTVTPRTGAEGGTVDGDPSGVTAAWLPGMNARPCRTVLAHGTAAQAHRLARDIRAAPNWPAGEYNCGLDSEVGVELVFGYGANRHELILVQLDGCLTVGARKKLTDAVRADLRPLAPPAWLSYLRP